MRKILHFIVFIIVVLCLNPQIALPAKPSFQFPHKLRFNLYQNNQLLGKVYLYYTKNSGITRFHQPLSSLRWTIQAEGENEPLYSRESYVFRDTLSLYRDTMISIGNQMTSDITLTEKNAYDRGIKRTFALKAYHPVATTKHTQIFDRHGDVSQTSALLFASWWASQNDSGTSGLLHFFSHNQEVRVTNLMVVDVTKRNVLGKKRLLKEIVITRNNKELYRFLVTRDAAYGYWFPVAVYFNSGTAPVKLRLELIESPVAPLSRDLNRITVVYLDFLDVKAHSLRRHSPLEQKLQDEFSTQLKNQLNELIIRSNKQLVLDIRTASKLNTPSKIRTMLDTVFDQELSKSDIMKKVISTLNIPSQTDIIVTGQYTPKSGGGKITIRPLVIMKNNIRFNTGNIEFNASTLFCHDRLNNKKNLCPGTPAHISAQIRTFLQYYVQLTRGSQGLSIEDVYRMILENKFFCHSTDYGYHYQVLEKLRQAGLVVQNPFVMAEQTTSGVQGNYTYTFLENWDINAEIEKNKALVKTVSSNRSNYSDIITLYWDPVEGQTATYYEARQFVEQLNAQKHEGFADWRLPTLEEILIVAGYNKRTRSFLPFGFLANTSKIWTATPLADAEKRKLNYDNTDVYFVVNRIKQGNKSKLQFDIQDQNDRAFTLIVRSPHRAVRRIAPTTQNHLKIAYLPFMKTREKVPMVSGDLARSIDVAVKKGMHFAASENSIMSVRQLTLRKVYTVANAGMLTDIFFNPNLTNDAKLRGIINRMMTPYDIDLLVTGYFIEDKRNRTVTLRPIVIYKYNKDIQTESLQFNRGHLQCPDGSRQKNLCGDVAQKITKAVKSLLNRA